MQQQDERMEMIAWEIFHATREFVVGERDKDQMPTSAELARKLGFRLETVKKKVRTLWELGWVQSISLNPKRYRFDLYRAQSETGLLPEDEEGDWEKTFIRQLLSEDSDG